MFHHLHRKGMSNRKNSLVMIGPSSKFSVTKCAVAPTILPHVHTPFRMVFRPRRKVKGMVNIDNRYRTFREKKKEKTFIYLPNATKSGEKSLEYESVFFIIFSWFLCRKRDVKLSEIDLNSRALLTTATISTARDCESCRAKISSGQ